MIGSSIAIRYSAQRPQFGDKLIMDYLSHQRRLLPGLAATYALHLGLKQLKVGGRNSGLRNTKGSKMQPWTAVCELVDVIVACEPAHSFHALLLCCRCRCRRMAEGSVCVCTGALLYGTVSCLC